MDAIFKALNDPARREILDSLRRKDGQTLSELETQFDMTRFGVMKHLKVLEEASLVIPRKAGRFKHHYLNAVPLQEVIDRWIEPLVAKKQARALIDLKSKLQGPPEMFDTDKTPDYMHQTTIRCTQDDLWAALTDPARIAASSFVAEEVRQDGDAYDWMTGGRVILRCRYLELTPKTRIVSTFEPQGEDDGKPSTCIYHIRPEGDCCMLIVEHFDLTYPPEPGKGIADGWPRWAASLKSWLETGQPIRVPMGG